MYISHYIHPTITIMKEEIQYILKIGRPKSFISEIQKEQFCFLKYVMIKETFFFNQTDMKAEIRELYLATFVELFLDTYYFQLIISVAF